MLRGFIAAFLLTSLPGVVHSDDSLPLDWGKAWSDRDEFELSGKDGIRFAGDVEALNKILRESGSFSVALRFRTAEMRQKGPARLFSISKDTSNRNLTIGQEGEKIEVRLRTTETGNNGLPGFSTEAVLREGEWIHLTLTREEDGKTTIFLDGEEQASREIKGDLSNWNPGFPLLLGDEASGGRGWEGRIRDLGLWPRALRRDEISDLAQAGAAAAEVGHGMPPGSPRSANALLFETKITTILTQHCLECHDSATADGNLDLSKSLASHFAEGILVPGKSADSLLWESIENDDMPHKREPLAESEKEILREWIDGGAAWTVDFIDPALYSRPVESAPTGARRLTVTEYINTVRDVFGVDISAEARELLPPEVRVDGFSNTDYNLRVDLKHIEGFSRLAEILVGKLDVAAFAKRFSNQRDLTDKTMIGLIEKMTPSILRGPPRNEETALYRGISTSVASAGGDFDEAVAFVIQAMVQSPRFLYRIEKPAPGNRARRVDDYEFVSRLSYTLWGSAPDRELLKLAGDRAFDREGILAQQIRRMLDDPLAIDHSLEFCSEWLHLDRLKFLQPGPDHFPDWDPVLASKMKEETLRFFREVVWEEDRPLGDLMNAPFTFLDPQLAEHYRIDADLKGERLVKVDLSEKAERGGLLTQGSLLTIGGDDASMVSRGLFVLNDLLRGVIKDPPPCVDTTPETVAANRTRREIAMERVANKSCGGCHAKFEPLAYGFEKFDGLGSYMSRDEQGNVLREDGEILFPGEARPVAFDTVAELMDLLAASSRVQETMTWKITQFALGRPLNANDTAAVSQIHEEALKRGGRYRDALAAIAESRLLRWMEPSAEPDH